MAKFTLVKGWMQADTQAHTHTRTYLLTKTHTHIFTISRTQAQTYMETRPQHNTCQVFHLTQLANIQMVAMSCVLENILTQSNPPGYI
ncbi:unnamed protein product [Arctogadus glacialis]